MACEFVKMWTLTRVSKSSGSSYQKCLIFLLLFSFRREHIHCNNSLLLLLNCARYCQLGAIFTKGLSQVLGLTFAYKCSQVKPEMLAETFGEYHPCTFQSIFKTDWCFMLSSNRSIFQTFEPSASSCKSVLGWPIMDGCHFHVITQSTKECYDDTRKNPGYIIQGIFLLKNVEGLIGA